MTENGLRRIETAASRILRKAAMLLKRVCGNFLPLTKNTVLFDSFWGQYNDNPKYISEKLHAADPQIRIVWSVDEKKGHDRLPDYAEKVHIHSREYERLIYSANVVVDNMIGLNCVGGVPFKSRLLRALSRRRDQLCISTWHGTLLKRAGKDQRERRWLKDYISSTSYCLAGCRYFADILENSFFLHGRVRNYGTPRNDILFKRDLDTDAIKEKLRLPKNKRVLLFAPTYRDHSVEWSGLKQLKMLNISELLACAQKRWADEFVFVFRVHHSVLKELESASILPPYGDQVIDGNDGDDMAEYLACTDVLLTDYSGSLFDFALTGKPCFLFAPDREQYEEERGLYRDYDWLPYPKAYTHGGLLKEIQSFDEVSYKRKLDQFLADIGNFEDGHAAERVVNDILHHMNRQ